jgi:chromate transporter
MDRELDLNSGRTTESSLGLPAAVALEPSVRILFLSFLRLGATSFGGPSMVAYIRRMAVEKNEWMDERSFLEGVALCQIIPGATAMQTAAYVGLRVRGLIGSAATFIGFGLPAFILMMIVSALYTRTHTLPAVLSAFQGLQAIVVAIVANATVSFARLTLRNWKGSVTAAAAAVMFGLGINPILVILYCMLLGLVLKIDAGLSYSTSASSISHFGKGIRVLIAAACAILIALFWFQRPLFDLAALMSLVNLFSFGGGFAAIPLMLHEVVDVHRWLDSTTFLNGIVLGQITPGPIVITATFVGYLARGPWGGLAATAGMFFPSFLLVAVAAPFFGRLLASARFLEASSGSLCSFVGLLLTVTARFASGMHWNAACIFLAVGAFVSLRLKVDILWVVLAGTVISVAVL